MKNNLFLFLFLVPAFLFAQYPTTGNKARLGYQTTGDGLIWRGVAADTAIKPRTTANAYFQLDTVNGVLRRYIATQGSWQVVGGGTNVDSLIYATRYWVNSNFFPLEGGTLTGTGGAGFVGFPSQVVAPGTPASGLNVYAQGSSFNWKGTDGFERLFASTLTGGRTYTLPDVSGTFTLGTGTTDRSARWSATNTLAAGNFTDNGTKVQALLPFQFQTYTTAGLPTGVTGYHVYNTTTNGPAWYQGSRWAYGLESTFNRGTATRVPFFDANGQLTENANFTYNSSVSSLRVASQSESSPVRGLLIEQNNAGAQAPLITFRKIVGSGAVSSPQFVGFFAFQGYSGTQYITDNAFFGANISGTVTSSSVPTSLFFRAGATNGYNPQLFIHHLGNVQIGSNGTVFPYTMTAPARTLTVAGELRVTDLTTDTPTSLTGVDSDGDFGAATFGSGVSMSGGALNVTTLYTGDGALNGNRMVNLNKKTLQYSNNAFFSIYSDQTSGTWGSSFELDTFSRTYQYRYTDDTGEPRYVLGHARGTRSSPTSLQKLDRTGGYYFQAYYNGAWRKTGVMLGEIDSVSGSSFARGVIRFSVADNNFPETTGADQLRIAKTQVTTRTNHVVTGKLAVGYGFVNTIDPVSSTASITHQLDVVGNAQITGKTVIGQDSTLQYDPATDVLQLSQYGTGTKEAADLSKTQSNYIAGFATDGTVLDLEQKRDTTIFVTADTDYDFSAAVTTAQIASRYNRVIIHMTLTSGVGADKTTTLHTPDANLMQCEILIRGTDNTGTYDNEIAFGTNNAISSDGTNTSGYTLAQGQGLHVRVVYNGSAYKYIYY